ncbi:MAG: proton-conducting transporter membrane subunit [Candidatus Promineifilaceae bacterium]|nr:proton-conducting transporter membrane subunit [Candidatus Promineifilaceae bacterium]
MNHLVILPVLIPLTAALVLLLLPRTARGWVATGAMAFSLAASGRLLWAVGESGQAQLFHSGGWFVAGMPVGITLVADWLSALFVVMGQLVLLAGFIYALGSREQVVHYPTFYTLFLLLATGLSGAFLTGDLFNLFVFAELLVISGTILTAVADDRYGVEAAFKYFYISLLAAAFLLLASGALYISYGTLNMAQLGEAIAAEATPLALVAAGLLLATFMVKSATVPFHFWQPDFHAAAPTPVSASLSSVVVKLGVYGYLRLTTLLFVEQAALIQDVLLVAGVVGILFGGLAAIGTHNAKRMLAYSTLAQIGFILVGVGWGTPLSIAAALVFAFNHALIKAAMLMMAGAVASRARIKSADFVHITAVGQRYPQLGLLFFVGALALAGIPPTNGFVSKLLIFSSGIAAARYVTLALIALASVLTLIYTMRAFVRIWWRTADAELPLKRGDRLIGPALLIALVLLIGLWADPLVTVATETARWLESPQPYIQAVLGQPALTESGVSAYLAGR